MNKERAPEANYISQEAHNEVVFPADIDITAIRELYEAEDDRFHDVLDDIAYDLIFENENLKTDFEANQGVIRGRGDENEKKQAAENNRALYARAKELVLQRAGIESVVVDEMEHAKVQISGIISEDRKENGPNADALTALGILSKDTDGNDRFTYPRSLMPDATNAKWHKYVTSVKEHMAAADRHDSQGTIMEMDQARRYAHNGISRDVQSLLGFPNTEEGFEEARKLVAKMRENRFPTLETGERSRVEKKVQKGMGGSVLAILRDNAGDLYDPESRRHHY